MQSARRAIRTRHTHQFSRSHKIHIRALFTDFKASSSVKRLVDLASQTRRGLDVSSALSQQLRSIVEQLQVEGPAITTDKNLSATWRLLFTTEKV
jgi:PAP_fibrillin